MTAGKGFIVLAVTAAAIGAVTMMREETRDVAPRTAFAAGSAVRDHPTGQTAGTKVDNPFGGDASAGSKPTEAIPPAARKTEPTEDLEPSSEAATGPAAVSRPSPTIQTGRSCEPTTCSRISTCEEARYRLETCGQTRLDGDGDGVPCEKLCG